jgi:hypothetical protein
MEILKRVSFERKRQREFTNTVSTDATLTLQAEKNTLIPKTLKLTAEGPIAPPIENQNQQTRTAGRSTMVLRDDGIYCDHHAARAFRTSAHPRKLDLLYIPTHDYQLRLMRGRPRHSPADSR